MGSLERKKCHPILAELLKQRVDRNKNNSLIKCFTLKKQSSYEYHKLFVHI